jgi:catechol 2,3-dioxygenase-like lactoylglutathione lyase family enzyme
MEPPEAITVNLILYCAEWEATVRFYRKGLGLPVTMENEWFVEFRLGADSRLSVADERRASIKSCGGAGITVSLQVADIRGVREAARAGGLQPTEIVDHPWGARVFYLIDPEGHRLEVWQGA